MPRPRFGVQCLCLVILWAAVVLLRPVKAQDAPTAAQSLEETGPLWAYAFSRPPAPGQSYNAMNLVRGNGLRAGETMEGASQLWSVPGSDLMFSRLDLRSNDLATSDWFPGDHPTMPDVIRYPLKGPGEFSGESLETNWSCGLCHLPNGKGRPENGPPAGQPAAYILQQLDDFANGLRYTSDPRKRNTPLMIQMAQGMSADEKLAAAQYFAAIPWTPWIRVIETNLVPENHIAGPALPGGANRDDYTGLDEGEFYEVTGTEPIEPIAGRILETPQDERQANYLRNSRSGWDAYVPLGSLARGQNLVDTGGGKTVSCDVCHGADLMGTGSTPGIAGRSPSYMMRQLWDMKRGTRNGPQVALMKPVIQDLTVADMTDIVAYLASMMPLTEAGPVAAP